MTHSRRLGPLLFLVVGCISALRCRPTPREYNTEANEDQDGSAGSPSTECDHDEDCDDHLACNGVEQCVDSVCVAASTPACAAEMNCDAVCTESPDGPQCSVVAADKDGDGWGSVLCVEDPGEDCNDDDGTIHADAEETCDGIDQNCNGMEDIDDGFDLSGEVVELTTSGAGIQGTWSPELGQFAIVERFSDAMQFRLVDPSGAPSEPVPIDDTGSIAFATFASGHGRFALVTSSLQLFDTNGNALLEEPAPIAESATRPTIVATSQGWLAFWTPNSGGMPSPQGRRFSADGAALDMQNLTVGIGSTSPGEIRAAVRDDRVGLVWSAEEGIFFSLYSDELIKLDSRNIHPSGRAADIAAGPNGYGIAWFESDFSLKFMQVDHDGSVVCGPIDTGVSLELNLSPHLSMSLYTGGFAVLYSDNASTRMHLLRVHDGCQAQVPPATVQEPSQNNKNDVNLSGNATGLIATWRDGPTVHNYRVMGGALCNLAGD